MNLSIAGRQFGHKSGNPFCRDSTGRIYITFNTDANTNQNGANQVYRSSNANPQSINDFSLIYDGSADSIVTLSIAMEGPNTLAIVGLRAVPVMNGVSGSIVYRSYNGSTLSQLVTAYTYNNFQIEPFGYTSNLNIVVLSNSDIFVIADNERISSMGNTFVKTISVRRTSGSWSSFVNDSSVDRNTSICGTASINREGFESFSYYDFFDNHTAGSSGIAYLVFRTGPSSTNLTTITSQATLFSLVRNPNEGISRFLSLAPAASDFNSWILRQNSTIVDSALFTEYTQRVDFGTPLREDAPSFARAGFGYSILARRSGIIDILKIDNPVSSIKPTTIEKSIFPVAFKGANQTNYIAHHRSNISLVELKGNVYIPLNHSHFCYNSSGEIISPSEEYSEVDMLLSGFESFESVILYTYEFETPNETATPQSLNLNINLQDVTVIANKTVTVVPNELSLNLTLENSQVSKSSTALIDELQINLNLEEVTLEITQDSTIVVENLDLSLVLETVAVVTQSSDIVEVTPLLLSSFLENVNVNTTSNLNVSVEPLDLNLSLQEITIDTIVRVHVTVPQDTLDVNINLISPTIETVTNINITVDELSTQLALNNVIVETVDNVVTEVNELNLNLNLENVDITAVIAITTIVDTLDLLLSLEDPEVETVTNSSVIANELNLVLTLDATIIETVSNSLIEVEEVNVNISLETVQVNTSSNVNVQVEELNNTLTLRTVSLQGGINAEFIADPLNLSLSLEQVVISNEINTEITTTELITNLEIQSVVIEASSLYISDELQVNISLNEAVISTTSSVSIVVDELDTYIAINSVQIATDSSLNSSVIVNNLSLELNIPGVTVGNSFNRTLLITDFKGTPLKGAKVILRKASGDIEFTIDTSGTISFELDTLEAITIDVIQYKTTNINIEYDIENEQIKNIILDPFIDLL